MSGRDRALLARAEHEALRASWLETAPNPRVGALALRGGQVVGFGHHAAFGGPHAEEAALRDAGAWDAETGSAIPGQVDEMVVTLEPCSSSGKKRPPCTGALLDAGVRRLVVGCPDPDPRHAGSGLERLRAAGVAVVLPEPEEGTRRFAASNRAFLDALTRPDRPWVLLKWASSVDGKLASDEGVSQWLTGPAARAEVHRLRALSCGVLAGAGTLLADDPQLSARPEQGPPALRSASAPARQPARILLGGADRVAAGAAIFGAGGPRIWVHGPGQQVAPAVQSAGDAQLTVARGPEGLELSAVLRELHAQWGIRRLFVEGGARVHGALLRAGLADALVRYEAPLLLGGSRAACAAPSFPSPQAAAPLVQEERADLGPDLRRAFLIGAPEDG